MLVADGPEDVELRGLHLQGVGEEGELAIGEQAHPRDGMWQVLALAYRRTDLLALAKGGHIVQIEYGLAVRRVQVVVRVERETERARRHRHRASVARGLRVATVFVLLLLLLLLLCNAIGALELERAQIVDADGGQVVEEADELVARAHRLTHVALVERQARVQVALDPMPVHESSSGKRAAVAVQVDLDADESPRLPVVEDEAALAGGARRVLEHRLVLDQIHARGKARRGGGGGVARSGVHVDVELAEIELAVEDEPLHVEALLLDAEAHDAVATRRQVQVVVLLVHAEVVHSKVEEELFAAPTATTFTIVAVVVVVIAVGAGGHRERVDLLEQLAVLVVHEELGLDLLRVGRRRRRRGGRLGIANLPLWRHRHLGLAPPLVVVVVLMGVAIELLMIDRCVAGGGGRCRWHSAHERRRERVECGGEELEVAARGRRRLGRVAAVRDVLVGQDDDEVAVEAQALHRDRLVLGVELELDAGERLLLAVDGERGHHLPLVEGRPRVIGQPAADHARGEQLVDVGTIRGALGQAEPDEAAQVVRVEGGRRGRRGGERRWVGVAVAERQAGLGECVARQEELVLEGDAAIGELVEYAAEAEYVALVDVAFAELHALVDGRHALIGQMRLDEEAQLGRDVRGRAHLRHVDELVDGALARLVQVEPIAITYATIFYTRYVNVRIEKKKTYYYILLN